MISLSQAAVAVQEVHVDPVTNVCKLEAENRIRSLTIDELMMVGGGECVVNDY